MKQVKDNAVISPPLAVYKPMLYSTPMIIANLEKRKTVTRRIIKNRDLYLMYADKISTDEMKEYLNSPLCSIQPDSEDQAIKYLLDSYRIKKGNVLWVRETWRRFDSMLECSHYDECGCAGHNGDFIYKASLPDDEHRFYPSIHMPKEACRMFKEVTDVRISRLQDITPEQAIAEGIKSMDFINEDTGDVETLYWHYIKKKWGPDPVHSFQTLWESINGPGSWESNPYVFEIHYKHLEGHQNPWRSNQ
jgi:hypothetical protein